jgi:hypothetical protein
VPLGGQIKDAVAHRPAMIGTIFGTMFGIMFGTNDRNTESRQTK